jgi:hypothetical protein
MKTQFHKRWFAAVLTVIFTFGLLTPSLAILDKTRFATDLGVAFFSFRRYVYGPYKNGKFASGAPGRTKALIKGGAALLFAVNRVKAANHIAHTSKSPLLHKLAGTLDNLENEYSTLGTKLKGGQFDPADVEAANTHVGAAGAGAAAAGIQIKDKAPDKPIPGTED